jgi:hypothetical protein
LDNTLSRRRGAPPSLTSHTTRRHRRLGRHFHVVFVIDVDVLVDVFSIVILIIDGAIINVLSSLNEHENEVVGLSQDPWFLIHFGTSPDPLILSIYYMNQLSSTRWPFGS